MPYGKELPIIRSINIGPSADAAISDNILCVIGSGSIYVFDISTPDDPVLLDSLNNLGNVRQVEIQNGFAYVTAREEGLYIINIKNPKDIVLSSHHDTLELGTGVAVSGSLVAVANRQYGVELVDVSDEKLPRFLGAIRTGEAQSVFIKDTLLFAGNWGEQKVSICNVADPTTPKLISEIPLDGFGDGLFVKGNLCFAATGHHSRGYKNYLDKEDPAFGMGHGMEIIDISDPHNPRKLSVLKFPKQFQRHLDMWDVQVSGDYAFIGDSESGLFVANVKDPLDPFFVGHRKFPWTTFHENDIAAPVGGFALSEDHIYVAGKLTDLYILAGKDISEEIRLTDGPFFNGKIVQRKDDHGRSKSRYYTDGQVHSAYLHKKSGKVFLAAGYGGVHEVSLSPSLSGKEVLNTGNVIFDVSVVEDKMFLAEGLAGFSVWEYPVKKKPKLLGQYKPEEGGVYQILINPNMKNAIVHVGGSTLDVVDITNINHLVRLKKIEKRAPMYRLPISYGLLGDSIACCKWHAKGFFMFNLNGDDGVRDLEEVYEPGRLIDGLAFKEENLLIIKRGGYRIETIKKEDTGSEVIFVDNLNLSGKPTIFNTHLYVSNRMTGNICGVDISDIQAPKKLWETTLSGNPALIIEYQEKVIVPAGRDGLYVYNLDGNPFYEK